MTFTDVAADGADGIDRLLRLLDFLAAFDAQTNPPVHDIAGYQLYLLRSADLPAVDGVRLTPGSEAWLTVDFVDLPPRPALPARLEPLLGPHDEIVASRRPVIRPLEQPAPAPESDDNAAGSPPVGHDPELLAEAEAWIDVGWRPWSERSAAAQRTKRLYRDLFELRDRLTADRESLELVWGFGRLRWQPVPSTVVDHPLLTIAVEIDIDPETNELRVRPDGAVEVESLFLMNVTVDDRPGYNASRSAIANDENATEPWDDDELQELLTRLVRSIDHDGVLVEAATRPEDDVARVDPSWALYLRRRRPDYQGFLDEMRELYRSGAQAPAALLSLVVDRPSELAAADTSAGSGAGAVDVEPLLLPKETNEEQQRILRQAQRRPGVTVQGPPGTGKSHTIANLISHYVAYGKRVLVVAEKEQALRVLAEKVPEEIRDLTVSVLGAEEDGQRRMESAISAIQLRVNTLDRDHADREIERLTTRLDEIDGAIAATTNRLLEARRDEVEALPGAWGPGDALTPSAAGAWLAANQARYGIISDEIPSTVALPVTPAEFERYLQLLRQPGREWLDKARQALPTTETLPASFELRSMLAQLDELQRVLAAVPPATVSWERIDAVDPSAVADLSQRVSDELEILTKAAGSWLEQVRRQLDDDALADEWQHFHGEMTAERTRLITDARPLEDHAITVPTAPEAVFVESLREARERLASKGKLGRFAGDAKKAVDACRVGGRVPTSAPEVDVCLLAITVADVRQRFALRWRSRMERVGGPPLEGPIPEEQAGFALDRLRQILDAPLRWRQLRLDLGAIGIAAPERVAQEDLGALVDVLSCCARRPEERLLAGRLNTLESQLRHGALQTDASPAWTGLVEALRTRTLDYWDGWREHVELLHGMAPHAAFFADVRTRLKACSPRWLARIDADPAVAGASADLPVAWQWRQLDTWVSAVERRTDPAALQRRLESLRDERRRVVTELVAERAWRGLADNIGDRERQALNSYVRAVKRFGKSGGKYAARWLTLIRQALNDAKSAVPVWIMTTSKALTSFRPDAAPPFDVLIIDEASQIGIEAVPLLSLARTAIVVGDDKQTSPENVGVNREAYFCLLDQYLHPIDGYRLLYDVDNSLYDLSIQKFPDVIMLTEHFRCLPEIISFSNTHAYDGRIVPLRDRAPHLRWRPLGAVLVEDGYRTGDTNPPEANAVADLITTMCADPAYDGMDFGVISLLGSTQSKLIWEKLYDRLGPETMQQRRIRCGEPANFQGDERNVMVLCTVVGAEPGKSAGRIGAMTSNSAKRRFNVAASRARDQMWIVHSVRPDRFPADDLRGALIRHCQAPETVEAELDSLEPRCDSDFERDVLRRILARNYRNVRVQEVVGRYRIDIVVDGPNGRLAVECDGDRWHGEDRWHQDRSRQEVLERAGWTFSRIRGSSFYRDPDNALEPLWARLSELGIEPGQERLASSQKTTVLVVSGRQRPEDSTSDVDTESENRLVEDRAVENLPDGDVTARSVEHVGYPRVTQIVHDVDSPDVRVVPPAPSPASLTSTRLTPYAAFSETGLIEVGRATPEQLIDGLRRIVAVEGPMLASVAYQTYVKASGGHRVGREIRSMLNSALHQAVRRGVIQQIVDATPGQADKTIYLPGTPAVVVRERGPRSLAEIPQSELHMLIEHLGGPGPIDQMARAVLDELGRVRLTAQTRETIRKAMEYTWS